MIDVGVLVLLVWFRLVGIVSHHRAVVQPIEHTRRRSVDLVVTATPLLPSLRCWPPFVHLIFRPFGNPAGIRDVVSGTFWLLTEGCHHKRFDVFGQQRNYLAVNIIVEAELPRKSTRIIFIGDTDVFLATVTEVYNHDNFVLVVGLLLERFVGSWRDLALWMLWRLFKHLVD